MAAVTEADSSIQVHDLLPGPGLQLFSVNWSCFWNLRKRRNLDHAWSRFLRMAGRISGMSLLLLTLSRDHLKILRQLGFWDTGLVFGDFRAKLQKLYLEHLFLPFLVFLFHIWVEHSGHEEDLQIFVAFKAVWPEKRVASIRNRDSRLGSSS